MTWFGDLSCTGNTDVETQHIDRLAREGSLFKQFYVASPICSPSRVAFTTGQYPARHLINSFLADGNATGSEACVIFWILPPRQSPGRSALEAT